jgi:hypothetical protein
MEDGGRVEKEEEWVRWRKKAAQRKGELDRGRTEERGRMEQ